MVGVGVAWAIACAESYLSFVAPQFGVCWPRQRKHKARRAPTPSRRMYRWRRCQLCHMRSALGPSGARLAPGSHGLRLDEHPRHDRCTPECMENDVKQRAGVVVWFTGLPSSGKSTLANRVRARLGEACCVLDGDRVRQLLHPSPGYGASGRDDFYVTLGDLAAELARQGLVVLVPATANRRAYREHARAHAPHFVEVWLDSPLDECCTRDAKGLYASSREGNIRALPGEDAHYEAPESADIHASGAQDDAALELILHRLEQQNCQPRSVGVANML